MASKYHSTCGLLLGFFLLPAQLPAASNAAVCTVSGDTLAEAANEYANSCALPVRDCDPVNGQWYCSSEKLDASDFFVTDHINDQSSAAPSSGPDTQHDALPDSLQLSCLDPDGDGWGWDGTASCRVDGQSSATHLSDLAVASDAPPSSNACVDGDGDGWGWDGTASCRVDVQNQSSGTHIADAARSPDTSQGVPNACLDEDGDGWGWDGSASCRVAQSGAALVLEPVTESNPVSIGNNPVTDTRADAVCGGSYTPSDITDLVLVTGQSNVTGADTSVSATLDQWGRVIHFSEPDQSHPRVFAWTVDPSRNNAGTGWQVAALNQSWHDSAPGVGGIARNNFAFHFAKQVAERGGCRVVGFVMVSEGGRGIAHWDNNATGWNEVVMQVTEALSAIGRSSIDGILWHQGESDWIVDGTCFTGQNCRNNLPDYYAQKLYSRIADASIPNPVGGSALIDRLRRESWYGDGKPFIAGETIQAPVNVHLNKLNTDNDSWTACVDSDITSGLGIREDDPFRNHYNAAGLRELGARYATEYLKMTGG